MILRVGMILDGYCAGAFGRYYGDKTVERIGADWVVARETDIGEPLFAKIDPEWLIPFVIGGYDLADNRVVEHIDVGTLDCSNMKVVFAKDKR